jgi:TonB family protein
MGICFALETRARLEHNGSFPVFCLMKNSRGSQHAASAHSTGHLSLDVDDAHPRLGTFGFEQQQQRMGPAVGAALVAHIVIAVFLIILIRLAPAPQFTPEKVPPETHLVYLQAPGPGGGGGGGGEQAKTPARKAQIPGKEKLAVAPTPPPPKKPQPKPKPEQKPQEKVNIPVQTVMAGLQQLPGVIHDAPSDAGVTRGSGSNGGAGTGSMAGIGEGKGNGLGPGTGGGMGGGAYRPGNGVDLPRVLQEVRPQYTSDAMRAKIQGTVWLECVVEPDGSVGNVRVVRSLDNTFGLDQEAIKAARQWRFAPGTKDGVPVPVLVTIELTFTLR